MDSSYIWAPIFLLLIAPASLAYPTNTRSHSLTLTNDASLNGNFYVSGLAKQGSNAANESIISLLSNTDLSELDIHRSRLRTKSNPESSIGDPDAIDLITSLLPNVSMEKRASDPQHSASLSKGPQSLVTGGALSTSTLVLHKTNLSGSVKAPPSYPVTCFNPYTTKMRPPIGEDCQIVINQIILRYPNPMSPQTFGYSASADIDLSLPRNEKWAFQNCVMFVRNMDKTRTDTFRIVDVALAAQRIITECVIGAKYPVGGTACVGTVADDFYVGVGGLPKPDATN
ncbi:hypothetical protein IMSHALPRED_002159 [Imshaugia aleurites]|uniref:Uncharacterized protein n=1 Tax=Imshaugia aleurites TaxID=172621 RepID=A0A8H3J4T4_9LECA|nr:hypothetical protein IMSHALPRED_002159 [Imshaugia aleurites]